MSEHHHDPQRTDREPGGTGGEDLIVEPENAEVDDWFGQDTERDRQAAEQALAAAGGDEEQAEELFEERRPEHKADRFNVPADERPA
ncbi:MAG: hypothetical protein R2761_27005 [Acidimicrobiales bacterium]